MAALISVIVTTYNREDALAASLRSLGRQTDPDFEVIVADDGSGPATAALVETVKSAIGHRVVHVWHEDKGFRAGEIRNRAVLASRGDYIVFLDGDCIVRPDFVAIHRRLAVPGCFVTGNDAAAKRDVLTAITTRFPPAHVLVAETYVQGPRAVTSIVAALAELCERGVDVVILARGGGSFEDLLPFSDERVVRAVAASPVPVVSAVGHEQDTPLCDLAADVRASTPSVAGRLVVPDLNELRAALARAHTGLAAGARRVCERRAERLGVTHERLSRAPLLALERRRARLDGTRGRLVALSPRGTLERGYAIVRAAGEVVKNPPPAGTGLEVEVAAGSFGARVE